MTIIEHFFTLRMMYRTACLYVRKYFKNDPQPPQKYHFGGVRFTEFEIILWNFSWTKYRGCSWLWTSIKIRKSLNIAHGWSASPGITLFNCILSFIIQYSIVYTAKNTHKINIVFNKHAKRCSVIVATFCMIMPATDKINYSCW